MVTYTLKTPNKMLRNKVVILDRCMKEPYVIIRMIGTTTGQVYERHSWYGKKRFTVSLDDLEVYEGEVGRWML